MGLFFAFGQLIAGIYFTLIGFKVINIFKGKMNLKKNSYGIRNLEDFLSMEELV